MTDKLTLLVMYVIYDRPDDFPKNVVMRKHLVTIEGSTPGESYLYETIDEARNSLPPGLKNIGRQVNDEPQIVEVWV